MDVRKALTISLPFEFSINGYLVNGKNREYVAWSRDHSFHPFGTHEVMPNGSCEHGHYFATRDEAFRDLIERATR